MVFASLASLVMLVACERASTSGSGSVRVPEGGVVIDADVAGTKVFYGEKELGIVPVRLTAKKLEAMGLPRSDADHVILGNDGWGEGLFLGVEDKMEHKIHFLAPDPKVYFLAQTPWGARTRTSGGSRSMDQNYFKVELDTRASETVDVTIEPLGWTAEGFFSVRVTAKNKAYQPFTGYQPELLFHWGSMVTPWRTRSRHEVKLPKEWSSFTPNESRSTVISLPLADLRAGVSLFCVMHLFEDAEGEHLVGKGAVYGDSIWVSAALESTKTELIGTDQSTTRSETESDGRNKSQPESEGRSR